MANSGEHIAVLKTVAQAKEQFSELVSLAGRGVSTTITRHKKPVARLIPAELDSRRLTDQWRRRVASTRLNREGQPKLSIARLIGTGRK